LDGGPPRACEAGKAYLLSEEAPAWYGVCYVNRPATRQALAGLAGIETRIARADRAAEQRDRLWEAGLPATLSEIARKGGSHWLPRLEAMGEAGQEAARVLRGQRLPELLVRQIADPALPERERGEAFDFYFLRQGPLTDEVTTPVLESGSATLTGQLVEYAYRQRGEDPALAERAAVTLLDRFPVHPNQLFWSRAHRIQAARLLEALGKTEHLERLSAEEPDPLVRQAAADLCHKLRGGEPRGVAALPWGEYPPETWPS
ncbi:hypothetical protein DYH09_04010, partial [bacterium CPR1]|nr:hypothetical protein [bacterium CPR1]